MASSSGPELSAELEAARLQLGAGIAGVKRSMDVRTRFQRSYAEHSALYIGGIFVAGVALAYFMSRRPKTPEVKAPVRFRFGAPKEKEKTKRSALGVAALGFLAQMAKPMIMEFVKKQATERFFQRKRARNAEPRF